MKKYLGLLMLLAIVVLILFFGKVNYQAQTTAQSGKLSLFNYNFSLPSFGRTSVSDPQIAKDAYSTFERYINYARSHDLVGLETVSYKISATCSDPTQEQKCFELMDNVAKVGALVKESDFKNVFSDDKQIVIFTDFRTLSEPPLNNEPVRFVLFFVRDENKQPKVLGLKLCHPDVGTPSNCVETNLFRSDKNNNGWWDEVEAFF